MNKNIVTIVLLVVVGGAGFFAGTKYQQTKTPSPTMQLRGRNGANRNGFRPVAGEIVSADDKSITLKLMDGSSKIILLSDKTNISKASEGSKSDLQSGIKVAVFGTENSDGSITAANIQINPTNMLIQRSQNQQNQ